MKHLQLVQGSQEWKNARLGIPTASNFHKIITPAKLELSKQRKDYMHQLLAEWLTGESSEDQRATEAMDRGTFLQPEAIKWYEFDRDVTTIEAGFCLTDDGLIGCSPDFLVGEDGGGEVKCPMSKQCVAYMIGSEKVEEEHRLQIQGCLYVTGRAWWDAVVYNPAFGGSVVRVLPDPEVQKALAHCLGIFLAEFDLAKKYLAEKGLEPKLVRAA